jgi:PAS domain S-box-containing protein
LPTIVLVDDAADIRRLVRTRLRLSGVFDVVGEGGSGVDAVALAAQHQPELMLLDMSMAGIDGLEAIPLVLTASPRTRVVMYSGFEKEGLSDAARAVGASDFIPKSEPIGNLPRRLLEVMGEDASGLPEMPPPDPKEQESLNEHLERFSAAFEEAAIGMATMSLSGRIVRANAALARLLQSHADRLVGSAFVDVVDDDDKNAVNAMILRVASGVIDADSTTHQIVGMGHVIWATTTAAVVRDSSANPLYLFIQVQDITARIATEESLRRSEERFRLLVESVRDYGIFILDPKGHIVSWNAGAERIKGWTADEIIGEHFRIFYTQEARDRKHPEYELEVASADGRYEEEGWRVRRDGTMFWANVVITALRDPDGSLVGFAKVTRDVSDRHELLLERERVAKERTEFLAVTAHELRGPIALLQGFSDLLHSSWREIEEGEREEMLGTLVRSSTRLQRLVDDLLTASRLEAGVLDVRPQPIDLSGPVRAIVNELAPDTVVDIADGVRAMADPTRLQQMLGNYLNNALRYGSPPITVTASRRDGFVDVAVDDSGPGVAPDIAARLFEKFAHGGRDDSTGLGLFIVRELARAQGGDAFLDATSGAGSRFVLRLPLAPDDQ